jgi:glycosyltransferase involved in cell wall biosynthesis
MRTIRSGAVVSELRDPQGPRARKGAITTLYFPTRPAWRERLDMLDVERMSGRSIVGRLVTESRYYETMVLNGDGAPITQLAAAAVIARRRNPPRVIFADCAWGSSAARIDRIVDRAAIRLIDGPGVHYCVHSREQQRCFPEVWGVAEERVHVNPYYYTLTEEELAMPTQRDGSVFSGGRSRRDFTTLIEAAAAIAAPVTIGGQISAADRKRLLPNVRAELLPHEEFISLLRRSSVVVVSLEQTNRSAGEQTYLNAMAMGKPVIVTDTMGAREYVEHGDTGLIVPPAEARALTAALEWMLDPANDAEVEAMARRAREVALTRFSPDAYIANLLAVLDQVEAKLSHSPRSPMQT